MDKKILIIGAYGQLGSSLREKYPAAKAVDSDILDITDREQLENFDWQGIEIIINAAGYTNVDGAETTEGRVNAWRINAEAVANLVAVAAQKDITLVHISTDYVFDGTQTPHFEDEVFSPLSVYGASKAAGDLAVSLLPKFYILRTSWVIGQGKNFVRTMIDLAEKNISPTVVNDQVGRLTFTSELTKAIDHLLATKQPYGTYSATNDGTPVSWADITMEIFRILGRNDLKVTKTSTEKYFASKEGVAPRPLNSIMDLTKLRDTGFKSRMWQDDLEHYINRELKNQGENQ